MVVALGNAIQTITPAGTDSFMLETGQITTVGQPITSAPIAGSMIRFTGLGDYTWAVEYMRGTWDWS